MSSSVKGLEDSIGALKVDVGANIASFRHDIDNALRFGKIVEYGSVLVMLAVLATVLIDFFLTHELAVRLEGRVTAIEKVMTTTTNGATRTEIVPNAPNRVPSQPARPTSGNGPK